MNTLIRVCFVVLCCSGCGSPGLTAGDGGGSGDDGGGGDGGATSDGPAPTCSATSPSGYACDPWSVHLYMVETIRRQGGTVRLQVVHNPEYEGGINDMTIPAEHDYSQLLTVDLQLTDAVRQFLCVAFNPHTTPATFDASSPSFSSTVDPSYHGLLNADSTGMPSVANLIDICGSPTLASVYAPVIATSGRPTLPDVALAIPLQPRPRDFTVGTTFHAWVARGILYVDEESELSPDLSGTVAAVQ